MIPNEHLNYMFCCDAGLPLKITAEPYFSERLELYDEYFHCKEKYQEYLHMLSGFATEEDYIAYRNNVRNAMVSFLSERINVESFKQTVANYTPLYTNLPSKPLYKATFDKKYFVSFDMKKGNFTTLRHFDANAVNNAQTYEEFVSYFTDNTFLAKSKHLRQSTFGRTALNDKLYGKYEMKLMEQVIKAVSDVLSVSMVRFRATDEVVFELNKEQSTELVSFFENVVATKCAERINIRCEVFQLHHMPGLGYIKEFLYGNEKYAIKGVSSSDLPFLLRKIKGENYQDSDFIVVKNDEITRRDEAPEILLPDFLNPC